jgi:cytochrome c oxidase assembly protein subunit 11
MSDAPRRRRMALTAASAALVVAGMTGMAFAAVPLYQAFCKLTGYGGTTQTASAAPSVILDRTIDVRFDANIAPGLPIEFAPEQRAQTLRLGETGLAFYRVRNLSDRPVTAVATYNVTPHAAGPFFVKLECFCFQERVLAPGESADLPVVYFVDAELASDPDVKDLGTVTLSYTFFNRTDQAAAAPEAGPRSGAR